MATSCALRRQAFSLQLGETTCTVVSALEECVPHLLKHILLRRLRQAKLRHIRCTWIAQVRDQAARASTDRRTHACHAHAASRRVCPIYNTSAAYAHAGHGSASAHRLSLGRAARRVQTACDTPSCRRSDDALACTARSAADAHTNTSRGIQG